MGKKFLTLALALFVLCAQAFAQSTVSGRVTDESGEPLVEANVIIKGTLTGTTTNLDGYWTLPNVKSGTVLEFSSIGFATQSVTVGSKKTINVVLKSDALFLNDAIVVGYGSTKRKDLTGSITQIDNKILAMQNTSSASKALEGAVPGLIYASVDAQPGNDAGLRVRGLGSTSANYSNALVIIDGSPAQGDNPLSQMNQEDIASITVLKDAASTAIYGSRGANGVIIITTKSGTSGRTKITFQARTGWNTVGTYKMGQVDNAAGIYEYVWKSIYNSYRYGVNGTGGPVLDKTTGEYVTNVKNPNVSDADAALFASQHLFNYIGSTTDFSRNTLGNYMAYNVPGAIYNPDGTSSAASSTMTGAYLVGTDGKINPDAKLLYNDTYADALLKTGIRQQYDISASGGNDKEDHYLSLGYLTDPSYVPNSNFQRITGRAKINANLFKWMKAGTNISFSRTKTNYMGTYWAGRNSGSNQGSIPRFVNGHTPIIPFYSHDADGNIIYDANGDAVRNYLTNSTYSPLGQTQSNYGSTDIRYALDNDVRSDLTTTLNTRSFLEIPFLEHFSYRVDLAYDKISDMMTRYYNGTTGRAAGMGGYFGKRSYETEVLNIQDRLNYTQDFKKHHIDAMALYEYSGWEQEQVSWGSYDEFIPGFLAAGNFVGRYGGAGSAPNPGYGHDIERMKSYLGRANYIYAEKYYLSASIRCDGSSKFRKDNRWGTFWSVGGGWRFTEEPFMKELKESWFTNGKLRASYGLIGNQNGIGRYQTYRTWGYSTAYKLVTNGTGQPTGSDYRLSMGGLVNTDLTWEKTKTFDVGLDMTFLNRIDVTLDYYNRVTGNSQFAQPVSFLATGQNTLPRNIAEITNRGVEIDINADIIRTKDWRWNVAFNASHYTTKLTDLPADAIPAHVEGLPDGTWEDNSGAWSSAGGSQQSASVYLRGIGRDWYNLYMFKYAGVDDNTGLPMYWHRVTEADHTAGKYSDTSVGGSVKTNNYANASKYEVGSAIPDLAGGFNTNLRYKNWDLGAQFAYQLGGKFFSRNYAEYLYNCVDAQMYKMMFVSKKVKGHTWTTENTGTKFPMQWYPAGNTSYFSGTSTNGGDWSFTDMSLFSASYLRLKNITIGYTAPKVFLSKINLDKVISSLRFFASADNLFILSAAKAVDPSMSASGGYNDVDSYTFPNMRTYTVGVNVDF
ncbi:MAG: SusC/RagA family TonB-linked outer membrane protein [Bacteroidales bacterium]|nr:SusC/RagA family TonB-linked outer membrane protein [Bacteroidales bacterium]